MTDIETERDLRELFARRREMDRSRTPPFEATLAAARRHRVRPRWTLRVAAAAAAIILITFAYEQRQSAARHERTLAEIRHRVLAGTGWPAPTDFLLDTPGSPLLRTVPTFGSATWMRTRSTNLRTRNRP